MPDAGTAESGPTPRHCVTPAHYDAGASPPIDRVVRGLDCRTGVPDVRLPGANLLARRHLEGPDLDPAAEGL